MVEGPAGPGSSKGRANEPTARPSCGGPPRWPDRCLPFAGRLPRSPAHLWPAFRMHGNTCMECVWERAFEGLEGHSACLQTGPECHPGKPRLTIAVKSLKNNEKGRFPARCAGALFWGFRGSKTRVFHRRIYRGRGGDAKPPLRSPPTPSNRVRSGSPGSPLGPSLFQPPPRRKLP